MFYNQPKTPDVIFDCHRGKKMSICIRFRITKIKMEDGTEFEGVEPFSDDPNSEIQAFCLPIAQLKEEGGFKPMNVPPEVVYKFFTVEQINYIKDAMIATENWKRSNSDIILNPTQEDLDLIKMY